jgi:hypothetical protein
MTHVLLIQTKMAYRASDVPNTLGKDTKINPRYRPDTHTSFAPVLTIPNPILALVFSSIFFVFG